MKQYFEVKLKYLTINEKGKEVKVTESYLVDSVTWTEAEARTLELIQNEIGCEFEIANIKPSKYIEVFNYSNSDLWVKVVTEMIIFDENTGKEKRTKATYIIAADSVEQAADRIKHELNSNLVPFVITELKISNIVDVFDYEKID